MFILEFGGGATVSLVTTDWETSWGSWSNSYHRNYYNVMITGLVGIRIQDISGILFRAGFTPLINLNSDEVTPFKTFAPWAGISLGYSFGR